MCPTVLQSVGGVCQHIWVSASIGGRVDGGGAEACLQAGVGGCSCPHLSQRPNLFMSHAGQHTGAACCFDVFFSPQELVVRVHLALFLSAHLSPLLAHMSPCHHSSHTSWHMRHGGTLYHLGMWGPADVVTTCDSCGHVCRSHPRSARMYYTSMLCSTITSCSTIMLRSTQRHVWAAQWLQA